MWERRRHQTESHRQSRRASLDQPSAHLGAEVCAHRNSRWNRRSRSRICLAHPESSTSRGRPANRAELNSRSSSLSVSRRERRGWSSPSRRSSFRSIRRARRSWSSRPTSFGYRESARAAGSGPLRHRRQIQSRQEAHRSSSVHARTEFRARHEPCGVQLASGGEVAPWAGTGRLAGLRGDWPAEGG
jgi:hypothetical protein